MAATNNGVMAKLIRERNVLGTIVRLAAAGRKTQVPIIHVRHAYRRDYLDAHHRARVRHAEGRVMMAGTTTFGNYSGRE
jgi:nicotinamidase-related amidase